MAIEFATKPSVTESAEWEITNPDIEALLANPPSHPVRMTVDPDLAQAMMEHNSGNRPLSKVHLQRLARQMKNGEFVETAQPVIFSKTGRLLDGQHRLLAIIESDYKLPVWVFFNEPDRNFAFYDIGSTRTGGDIFAMEHVPSANVAAAATRIIFNYDTGGMGGHEIKNDKLDNPDQLFRYAEKIGLDRLQDATKVGQAASAHKLPSPSAVAACYFICARIDRPRADNFFRKFVTGVGISDSKDAAHRLREHVLRNRQKRVPFAGDIIAAWNAYRRGNVMPRWYSNKPGQKFPRAQ